MKKILVVEDDEFLASAYREKLTQEQDFDVRIAHDGSEALTAVEEAKPDIVLLDIVMPKMDGLAFLEELRNSNNGAGVRVIITSNITDQEKRKRADELGAEEYFMKSDTSIQELVELCKE